MLIWLNGAHGAGKTSVARRIQAMRPGSWLFDPEQIGFMLRRAWPGAQPGDFKDMRAWRELTVAALRAACAEAAGKLVIVPMTLTDPGFNEVVGVLRMDGIELGHFTLTAAPDTLRHRLRRRLDWPRSRRWALSRVDAAAAALADERFAIHFATDGLSVAEVAEAVLTRIECSENRQGRSG